MARNKKSVEDVLICVERPRKKGVKMMSTLLCKIDLI